MMKFMSTRFGNINCKRKCSEWFNECVNDKYDLIGLFYLENPKW